MPRKDNQKVYVVFRRPTKGPDKDKQIICRVCTPDVVDANIAHIAYNWPDDVVYGGQYDLHGAYK